MEILGLILFILFSLIGLVLIALGFAGTFSIWLGSLIYASTNHFENIGWEILLLLLGLAIAGEVVEATLGALGAKKFGASRRSSLSVLVGGMLGGIVGGVFAPIIGSLVGVIIGGCLAPVIVEYAQQKEWPASFKAGLGALLGRMGGSLLKLLLAWVMIVIVIFRILPR